jgi:hypothetical protein
MAETYRSHAQIIVDNGGPAKFGRLIGVPPRRPIYWLRLDSIPSGEWKRIADMKLATLTELAAAAERREQNKMAGAA